MGRDAFDASSAARDTFCAADAALGWELSRMCFDGPEEELQLTVNTQPAVLTTSVALWRALGETCDVAAGHSLGEYSAHVAAGTLHFEQAVRLVRLRGQYMQQAVPVGAGAMAAVMGLEATVVADACVGQHGVVETVNFNSPGQTVIAGDAAAVGQAAVALRALGGKVMSIPVSAPFHSSLMRAVEPLLAHHLAAAAVSDPSVPVYANVDAMPVATAARARETLVLQVSKPVLWQQCVERMVEAGVRLFVEIGPGKVLTGLIGRIARNVERVSVQQAGDFESARAAITRVRGASM